MAADELPTEGQSVITCRLLFPDGETVTAQICARSRYDDCQVAYAGAVGRLPFSVERADSVVLPAYFKSFARELRARFQEERTGEWPSCETDEVNSKDDSIQWL